MPAEPGIVKVNNVNVIAGNDQVVRVQVCVDQAVRSSPFAVIGQDSINQLAGVADLRPRARGQLRLLPERPPERLNADQSIGVKCVALESGGSGQVMA